MTEVKTEGGYRTERYDSYSTRIICEGGWVVAMIESLANGRWVICVGDQRYTNTTFASAKAAFKWWKERQAAQGTEAQRAETSSGSVHDGPVAKPCAQTKGQSHVR